MNRSKVSSGELKGSKRRKQRSRKHKNNSESEVKNRGVDYFDNRSMEVIKHRLAASNYIHTESAHDCTFRGEIVARRVSRKQGPQVLIHWFPEHIIGDEWISPKEFNGIKLVPLTKIPKVKLPILYPNLFPSSSDKSTTTSKVLSNHSETENSSLGTRLRSSSSKDSKDKDDEDWAINLLADYLQSPS